MELETEDAMAMAMALAIPMAMAMEMECAVPFRKEGRIWQEASHYNLCTCKPRSLAGVVWSVFWLWFRCGSGPGSRVRHLIRV